MDVKDLKPELIWHYFDEITKVPRPSKKEGKIRAFLLDFAREHHLDAKEDATGNIVIAKAATQGFESSPGVILQSHMDMVCEKNSDVIHDFENDPIETYIDGEWVRAKGTTLGADNGIGMAASLAVLASDNLQHGPLEALFTVDEETGLTGAFGMKEGFISGDYLLNLDSEDDFRRWKNDVSPYHGFDVVYARVHLHPTYTNGQWHFYVGTGSYWNLDDCFRAVVGLSDAEISVELGEVDHVLGILKETDYVEITPYAYRYMQGDDIGSQMKLPYAYEVDRNVIKKIIANTNWNKIERVSLLA